ncbi:MAG: LolA family protein [Bacteroidota bacterium]
MKTCFGTSLLVLLVLFFLNAPILQAQNFTPAKKQNIQEVLEKLGKQANTLQSEFIQEKHMSFLTEPLISQGSFAFAKPDKLRWAYTTPYHYIIVFNGDNIAINDGNQTSSFTTSENPIFAEVNNMMLGLIQGRLITDQESFSVEYLQSSDAYKLIFTPKLEEMREMLSTIEMVIDKQKGTAKRIRMVEKNEDYTDILFKHYKINEKLPEGTFSL